MSMAEATEPVARPARAWLLARHAGNILWLARYIERIENLARLLDVTRTFARDEQDTASWLAILRINADQDRFHAQYGAPHGETVARFYLLDRDNPTSVQAAVHAARENARTLRALISTEMWMQMNVFHARIRNLTEADIAPEQLSRLCAWLKEGCQAHTGITEGTFYRDQSWSFYMLGRHLERADQTTRLLDIRFSALMPAAAAGSEIDAGQWNALLRACAGYHAYRRLHPSGYAAPDVAGFLLLDGAFPRSLSLNLAQIEWHLMQLRARHRLAGGTAALERVDHLRAMLTEQSPADLIRRGLSPFMDWLQRGIAALSDDIAAAFFQ